MTAASADRAAVRAVLVKARERLSSPERWCQGTLAKGKSQRVPPWSRSARSWCLLGAVGRACCDLGEFYPLPAEPALKVLRRVARTSKLLVWNDDPARTHAEVLALLDRALARVAATEGEEG